MGWKSVEMQVAIPRTQGASNLQDQMSKHQQRFQDSLAQHQLREQLEKRKRVNEYSETDALKNELNSEAQIEVTSLDDQDNEIKEEQLEHPYKGIYFDFIR